MYPYTQDELDNHANQLNPNNDAYWLARGYDGRPDAWNDDDVSDSAYDLMSEEYYDYEPWCSDDFD